MKESLLTDLKSFKKALLILSKIVKQANYFTSFNVLVITDVNNYFAFSSATLQSSDADPDSDLGSKKMLFT